MVVDYLGFINDSRIFWILYSDFELALSLSLSLSLSLTHTHTHTHLLTLEGDFLCGWCFSDNGCRFRYFQL